MDVKPLETSATLDHEQSFFVNIDLLCFQLVSACIAKQRASDFIGFSLILIDFVYVNLFTVYLIVSNIKSQTCCSSFFSSLSCREILHNSNIRFKHLVMKMWWILSPVLLVFKIWLRIHNIFYKEYEMKPILHSWDSMGKNYVMTVLLLNLLNCTHYQQ